MGELIKIAGCLLADAFRFVALLFCSTKSLRAENLFLRRQLALFMERGVRPRRLDAASRVSLAILGRMFDWREALVVVQPATMVGWHRAGWRLVWRLKSRAGRPGIPIELRALIRRMAVENVSWGEERIADELWLKHVNVTANPTADWTLQQLREVVADNDRHKYLIHDRDKVFAKHLDASIKALGIEVLRSPIASPKANAICERVIGTIRRECLDWLIPISAAHLQAILLGWVKHYNEGRPHKSLGPGVPDPPTAGTAVLRKSESRHRLAAGPVVLAISVLGGLHHEYSLATAPAGA